MTLDSEERAIKAMVDLAEENFKQAENSDDPERAVKALVACSRALMTEYIALARKYDKAIKVIDALVTEGEDRDAKIEMA